MIRPMRTLLLLAGLVVASPVASNPMEDICHARAREMSGFKGAAPRAETRKGGATFRLSGSAAIGVSRESGPPVPSPRGGHGMAEQERQERKRRDKQAAAEQNYRKIYDDCMRDR